MSGDQQATGLDDRALARRALGLLDLTDLTDTCTEADIQRLCERATGPHGTVAAVCVWPRFAALARDKLAGSGVRVATVVNFPRGEDAPEAVEQQTRAALADGADEIDLVLPWRAYLDGGEDVAAAMVARIRAACGAATLKVILETGELGSEAAIAGASRLAIAQGADFIKTSTGKVAVNATLEAGAIMLAAIAESGRSVGLKPAGGIRSLADCARWLDLVDETMGPDWASPETFRFGASGVLDALNAALDGQVPVEQTTRLGGY